MSNKLSATTNDEPGLLSAVVSNAAPKLCEPNWKKKLFAPQLVLLLV